MKLKGVRWLVSFSSSITIRLSKINADKHAEAFIKEEKKPFLFQHHLSLDDLLGIIISKNKQKMRFLGFRKGNSVAAQN